jgi:hypothetical protein
MNEISFYKSVPILSPQCPRFVPVAYSALGRMDAGKLSFVPVSPLFFRG